MNNSTGIRSWVPRVLRTIVIIEIVYLVVLNAALNVPLTQTLINQAKPEKFHVSWDRAWTWYPFRVHATGISANGQTRSQQWQLDSPSAAGSISILPLLTKRVWLRNVVATDISYRQRPRLKPDKNYEALIPFFPEIEGRSIVPAETVPLKKKRPWRLAIDDISASGQHQLWIMQFRGGGRGDLMADLSYQSRGGPFSLSNGELDVVLDTLYVSGDNEVFRQGTVKGQLALKPFVPKENKNINIFKYVLLDADIDIDANSLAFINLFTRNFNDMTIDGSGHLDGRALLDSGTVLPGTDLAIEAGNISITVMGHEIEGEGALSFASSTRTDNAVELLVNYHDLELTHTGDNSPLLAGKQLQLELVGASSVFATQEEKDARRKLALSIDSLSAPDLALFQHYLPNKWPFDIHGGTGSLQASAKLTTHSMDIDVSVTSQAADLGLHQYRFDSDLEMALQLSNPAINEMNTDISGSYIKLTNANLGQNGQESASPWDASFVVKDGNFSVLGEREKRENEQLTDLFQALAGSEGTQVLGNLHGFMEFESHVSSLGWIGALLDESYHLNVSGRGELHGTVKLDAGVPAPGTDINIQSQNLGVGILDYVSTGAGRIGLTVDEGELGPDWLLSLALDNAELLREGEDIPHVEDVTLEIAALLEDFEKDARRKASAVTFRILAANVTDMSIYSSYLPPDSPLQIVDGTASLTAEILLEPEDADGWLKLQADGLEMIVDEQSISADLAAHITLVGGIPGEMIFDLSGSEIALNNVRVSGEKETFEQDNWLASFKLTQAQTTWKKPLKLDALVQLSVSDTSPVVAAFSNRGYRPAWLLNMLSIHDIKGTAKLVVADNKVVIPYANAVSDIVEVGAKGSITEQHREGVIYARYRKLDAVLKLFRGDKNVDLINAREKYDTYRVAQ